MCQRAVVTACLLHGNARADAVSARTSWLDSSYDYVTSRTDALAQRVDSFFGEADAERESADSVLRLVGESGWSEDDGADTRLRLKGKVDLPQLSHRLSLVFGEEDDYRSDVLPPAGDADGDIGVQYRLLDAARSRLDASFGANSSLDFHLNLRYRFMRPLGESFRVRFTERVYLKEGDGAGSITRGDLDYRISEKGLLRFTSDVEYGEETDGAEWGTRLSFLRQIDAQQAISAFAAVSGQTDPGARANVYAAGIRYRRNVLRPWIFVELEPARLWRREDEASARQGVWAATLRIELREEIGNRRAKP